MKDKTRLSSISKIQNLNSEPTNGNSLFNIQDQATDLEKSVDVTSNRKVGIDQILNIFRKLEDDEPVLESEKIEWEEIYQRQRKGLVEFLQDIGIEKEIKKAGIIEGECRPALVGHEMLNVDIPSAKVVICFTRLLLSRSLKKT